LKTHLQQTLDNWDGVPNLPLKGKSKDLRKIICCKKYLIMIMFLTCQLGFKGTVKKICEKAPAEKII
jgi:hypothetical protein